MARSVIESIEPEANAPETSTGAEAWGGGSLDLRPRGTGKVWPVWPVGVFKSAFWDVVRGTAVEGAGGSWIATLIRGSPTKLLREGDGDVVVSERPRPVVCCFRAMMEQFGKWAQACAVTSAVLGRLLCVVICDRVLDGGGRSAADDGDQLLPMLPQQRREQRQSRRVSLCWRIVASQLGFPTAEKLPKKSTMKFTLPPPTMQGLHVTLQRLRYSSRTRLPQDGESTKAVCQGLKPLRTWDLTAERPPLTNSRWARLRGGLYAIPPFTANPFTTWDDTETLHTFNNRLAQLHERMMVTHARRASTWKGKPNALAWNATCGQGLEITTFIESKEGTLVHGYAAVSPLPCLGIWQIRLDSTGSCCLLRDTAVRLPIAMCS